MSGLCRRAMREEHQERSDRSWQVSSVLRVTLWPRRLYTSVLDTVPMAAERHSKRTTCQGPSRCECRAWGFDNIQVAT